MSQRSDLEKIYKEHFSHLMHFGMLFTESEEEVEDAIQDLFIKLLSNKITLKDNPSQIKSYLFTSIKNHILNRGRALKNRDKHSNTMTEYLYPDNTNIEEEIIKSETLNKAMILLHKLPKRYQDIFIRSINKQSYQDIAEDLGLSTHTVKEYNLKARKILGEYNKLFYLFMLLFSTSICYFLVYNI